MKKTVAGLMLMLSMTSTSFALGPSVNLEDGMTFFGFQNILGTNKGDVCILSFQSDGGEGSYQVQVSISFGTKDFKAGGREMILGGRFGNSKQLFGQGSRLAMIDGIDENNNYIYDPIYHFNEEITVEISRDGKPTSFELKNADTGAVIRCTSLSTQGV